MEKSDGGGRWEEKERASCDARDGEEGRGGERGTEGSERGKERATDM